MRRIRFEVNDQAKFDLSIITKLWPYLLEFRQRIGIAVSFLVGAKIANVTLPFVLKNIVDNLNTDTALEQIMSAVIALLVAYGALRLANVLFGEIRDTIFGRVTERAMRKLGLSLFKHLHNLELDFHLLRKTGGLSRGIERGVSGISFLMRFLVFNIGPTLLEFALVIGILLYNYGLTFASIIFIAVISYVWFSVVVTNWRTEYVQAQNMAANASNSRAIDSLLNFETVKSMLASYFLNKKYFNFNNRLSV